MPPSAEQYCEKYSDQVRELIVCILERRSDNGNERKQNTEN